MLGNLRDELGPEILMMKRRLNFLFGLRVLELKMGTAAAVPFLVPLTCRIAQEGLLIRVVEFYIC
jgi:hypothetical protein